MSVHYSSAVWKAKIKDPIAKLVLLKLADNANDAGKCWPSIAKISEETGLCRRTVQTKIRSLEDLKLLKSVRGVNRCDYTLSIKNLSEITQKEGVQEMQGAGDAGCISRHQGVQEMHGGGAGDALAYREPSLNRQRTISVSENEMFLETLWKTFPQKSRERSSKKQLATEWKKTKMAASNEIIESAKKWASCHDWTKDNGQYAPGAHLWVRNRKWEIEPTPNQTNKLRTTNDEFKFKQGRNGLRTFD